MTTNAQGPAAATANAAASASVSLTVSPTIQEHFRMSISLPALRTTFHKRNNLAIASSSLGRLVFIGEESCGGTYVLRIEVAKRLRMPFGRFKRGKLIDVRPGQHVYVGSAISSRGATCLARRLVRHATRTRGHRPHPIRKLMLDVFPRIGLVDSNLLPPDGKTLHWNVDHLLAVNSVNLTGAYLIRSNQHFEFQVADLLESDPAIVVFERGLGAADNHGGTHLLRVEADNRWWLGLTDRLRRFLKFHQAAKRGM